MGGMTHGESSHKTGKTPEYRCWQSMKRRCLAPAEPGYELYGGRGINVCARWMEFSNFLADMGRKPDGTSIDRIDSNGHYEPQNCRWATPKEQQWNRRDNVMLTYGGRTQPISVWAKEVGLRTTTLKYRLRIVGMSVEDALHAKKHARN